MLAQKEKDKKAEARLKEPGKDILEEGNSQH